MTPAARLTSAACAFTCIRVRTKPNPVSFNGNSATCVQQATRSIKTPTQLNENGSRYPKRPRPIAGRSLGHGDDTAHGGRRCCRSSSACTCVPHRRSQPSSRQLRATLIPLPRDAYRPRRAIFVNLSSYTLVGRYICIHRHTCADILFTLGA